MPDLDSLLAQTMLFAGTRGAQLEPVRVAMGAVFESPVPQPQAMADVQAHERAETAMRNYVWQFRWDPGMPSTFYDVTILTRGMGMDYSMPAQVFASVRFDDVKITRDDGTTLELPLDAVHCICAWWTRTGEIGGKAAGYSPLWKLESKLDTSLLACFAYQLDGGRIVPLSPEEIRDLGDDLIPATGKRSGSVVAGDAAGWDVCIGPARYIVVVEIVLCRERPDFVPGNLVGFCRIHPHAFLWSNEDLGRVEASIVLRRPELAMGCDPTMERPIGAIVVTDTNDVHSASAWAGLPIPYADNLYDYYDTEAYETLKGRSPRRSGDRPDHPLQKTGEVTLADARYHGERTNHDVVTRLTPLVRNSRDIRKTARQGQFDNVHLAARMVATFEHRGDPHTESGIVMLNQCLHDCVHMHVRWSEFLEDKMLRGWGPGGPFTLPGAPAVPPNQTVFLSLPNRHSAKYRAVAQAVKAGAVQVICHHGAAYAVDAWPDGFAFLKIGTLHTAIAAEATLHDEPFRAELPFGWLEFYWRVRWTGTHGQRPVERLAFSSLEECMR